MASYILRCQHPAGVGRRTSGGFTLIEVLVVLILVGMTSGILFQAMQRAFGLQARFGSELFKAQQGQMATGWYRQTVQGLLPDYPGGSSFFRGDATGFAGLSSNPLDEDYGAPTSIAWKLQPNADTGTTDLVYTDAQHTTTVLNWRSSKARFVYLDNQLTPHEQWPPPLGLFAQLPTHIELQVTEEGQPVVILAHPMGPAEPRLRPQDVVGFIP